MQTSYRTPNRSAAIVPAFGGTLAQAAVAPTGAVGFRGELTHLGGKEVGNKEAGRNEGVIAAWTGGRITPTPGSRNGERRCDLFANEKPVLPITAKNTDQRSDKLAGGVH